MGVNHGRQAPYATPLRRKECGSLPRCSGTHQPIKEAVARLVWFRRKTGHGPAQVFHRAGDERQARGSVGRRRGITDFDAEDVPDDSTSKYDPLRIVSAAAETVWAVLMVACVLFMLWSMLGRGPTYRPSETSENHSGASASRPNHHRAGHHGLAGRRGSLLRSATEPAVNLDRCHAASTGSTRR